MDVGVGLPNPIPGTEGRLIVEWARRAEERGFSALATIDRVVYPSFESLVVLAAAAAATERVGLMTNILLAPTRNTILLAKEAASVDTVSRGRLTLGVAVGSRADDFEATEQVFHERGQRFDRQLEELGRAWRGEPVGGSQQPVVPEGSREIPILVGGRSDVTMERVVRHGAGWTAGGSAADVVGPFADRVRTAWKEAGREGRPRIAALTYFSLGDEHVEESRENLRHYYGYTGRADTIADGVPRTPEEIRDRMKRFEDAGVDELLFDPSVASLDQVDRLADLVL